MEKLKEKVYVKVRHAMNNNKEISRVFVEDVNIIVDAVMKEFEKYIEKNESRNEPLINDKKVIILSGGRSHSKTHLTNEVKKHHSTK